MGTGRTKNQAWLSEALRKLYHQLCHLRIKLAALVGGVCLLSVLSTNPAHAQSCAKLQYTERTGPANPTNGEDVGSFSTPYFVDIDNDGDQDLFVGEQTGVFFYYENTGTANSANYVQRTGASNPLNGFDVGTYSTPAFVDIDNDGDFDMFSGETDAIFNYFENTGTAASPNFVQRTGAANPLNGETVGSYWSAPFFVDIDNDGDFDMFSGEDYGAILYWENTGTVSSATFVQRTGANNPLDFVNLGRFSAPTFVDVDSDGDFDAVIGDNSGELFYFENIGSAATANYTERTGSSNPFNTEDVGQCSAPTLVDIDNDGDFDVFIGEYDGNLNYFELDEITVIATFDFITGSSNPFNGFDVGSRSTLCFADIDNDGDFDMFSGETSGNFNYFENTGNSTSATFTQQTGGSNPMNSFDIGFHSTPAIADLDNDGDFDIMSGEYYGTFAYFENTGTAASPAFTQRTGLSNPMNGIDIGYSSKPFFVDLDNDGDFDLVAGEFYGTFFYFENIGTALTPLFTQRTGTANPFNGIDVGTRAAPSFIDLDGDGDFDFIAGGAGGGFDYYENDGSAASPSFTELTGTNNPLIGHDVGSRSTPRFVDIDGDLDFDMFAGETSGNFNFYENICPASILPIELVFFEAEVQGSTVELTWQTASEVNNDFFTILRSSDTQVWEEIEHIKAPEGDSFELLDYSTIDPNPILGRSFYRLKQTDFDGKFSFSNIESVNVIPPAGSIQAYPNPVTDVLTYHVTTNSALTERVQLQIFDLTGKAILEKMDLLLPGLNSFELNLDQLQPGSYILRVVVNQGNVLTNRLLKRD